MVLGYSNFFHLPKDEYRQELKRRNTAELRGLEIGKTRGRISSSLTTVGGIFAAPITAGGSLIVSAIGARKVKVADDKLGMIRDELSSRGKKLHSTDAKDVAVAGGSWALGNIIAGGLVDVSIDGAFGGAAASSAAEDTQALAGEGGVSEGFISQGAAVPAMTDQLLAAVSDTAGPGVGLLATDVGQQAISDLGATAIGSTGAFVVKEVVGDVIAEGISKAYAQAFESDKCERNRGPQNISCDVCGVGIWRGDFMRKSST